MKRLSQKDFDNAKEKFDRDSNFSRKKDRLMKDIWSVLSYNGKYVIAGSDFVQRSQGADVILQDNNETDILVDTKNACGGYYKRFLLEEMSCSATGKKGWLLAENKFTNYLFFTYWVDLTFVKGYYIPYQPLRDWFLLNYTKYDLTQAENEADINHSTARLVPMDIVISNIKDIKLITRVNGEFGKVKIIDPDSQVRKQYTFDF